MISFLQNEASELTLLAGVLHEITRRPAHYQYLGKAVAATAAETATTTTTTTTTENRSATTTTTTTTATATPSELLSVRSSSQDGGSTRPGEEGLRKVWSVTRERQRVLEKQERRSEKKE